MASGPPRFDRGWVYPTDNKKKQSTMVDFMSYFHGKQDEPYEKDATFTREELLEITPSDILEWMNLKEIGRAHV